MTVCSNVRKFVRSNVYVLASLRIHVLAKCPEKVAIYAGFGAFDQSNILIVG